jgi:hypothetical protein
VTNDLAGPLEDSACPGTQALSIAESQSATESAPTIRIRDRRFLQEVRRLRLLNSFHIREATGRDVPVCLGALFRMRYAPWGRLPTEQEWASLHRLDHALCAGLSDPQRQKFAQSLVLLFLGYSPAILLLFACLSIAITMGALKHGQGLDTDAKTIRAIMSSPLFHAQHGIDADDAVCVVLLYFVWLVSMGCLGAVANIGMNAIAAKNDITFDTSNIRLIFLRIILGGLFAVILMLPLGSQNFIALCYQFVTGYTLKAEVGEATVGAMAQASAVVMPFLLGYSTTLVLVILNQWIGRVQSVFDKQAAPSADNTSALVPR